MDTPLTSEPILPRKRGRPRKIRLSPSIPLPRPEDLIVCIIDNDAAIRDSLSFLIESVRIPVTTFDSAASFLKGDAIGRAGCLLVDIRMPGMSGLELQAELNRLGIRIPMIIITGFGDVQLAVQAMKRGAFDFFEKPIHHQLLLDRIHQALAQEAATRKEAHEKAEFQRRFTRLSPTQKLVLDLVIQGKTNQEISADQGCALKTVEAHRAQIYAKMGCKKVATIVRMMLQQRIIDGDDE